MILTEDIVSIRNKMPEPSRFPGNHFRANIEVLKQGLGLNYEFPSRLLEEKNMIITFTKTLVVVDDISFYCWRCDLDEQLYI